MSAMGIGFPAGKEEGEQSKREVKRGLFNLGLRDYPHATRESDVGGG
jgi:hypothetical protein